MGQLVRLMRFGPAACAFARRLCLLVLLVLALSCDNPPAANNAASAPRIACLVPAATDLIIGMGAANHLVAVSGYDIDRPETRGLPRVGAYHELDWERIASARPDVLILFMSPQLMPPGLKERADRLNIRLVNVRIETLDDVFSEMKRLGELVGKSDQAEAASSRIRARLDVVRARVKDRPPVAALIVRDSAGTGVVGRDNFINDVLQLAGGNNVISSTGWPAIDAEQLITLRPVIILHLLPEASTQVKQEAGRFWGKLSPQPAAGAKRIHILSEWWLQQPGTHVADLAETFAELLHPRSLPSRNTP